MNEYTPTTEEVLAAYVRENDGGHPNDQVNAAQEFDRWMGHRDAEVITRFIAWADAQPAITWAGKGGLKERWEAR